LKELKDLYEETETFELDDRFSEPIRNYYYNYRSLLKYWVLTKDIITNVVYKNSDFFGGEEVEEHELDTLVDWEKVTSFDGEEIDHDFLMIPSIQKNLIICASLTLVETLLREVCKEIDPDYELNLKGSYVQRFSHYIRSRTNISIKKNFLRDFETLGHLRNSFIHQSDNRSVPIETIDYINSITGPFVDISSGVSNIHVELFLNLLDHFGSDFQQQYWMEFDRTSRN
jgi:hypothetical protein